MNNKNLYWRFYVLFVNNDFAFFTVPFVLALTGIVVTGVSALDMMIADDLTTTVAVLIWSAGVIILAISKIYRIFQRISEWLFIKSCEKENLDPRKMSTKREDWPDLEDPGIHIIMIERLQKGEQKQTKETPSLASRCAQ